MKKLQIDIPQILPGVPDDKDQCVQEFIKVLREEKGVEDVHVSDTKQNGVPQLCFHYDSSQISMSRIRLLAKQVGSSLTEKIGHRLIEVKGVRHTRQARTIELALRDIPGMIEAAVSATGMVRVE